MSIAHRSANLECVTGAVGFAPSSSAGKGGVKLEHTFFTKLEDSKHRQLKRTPCVRAEGRGGGGGVFLTVRS